MSDSTCTRCCSRRMAILIGFQSIVFATFTKIFAISEGLLPEDPRLTRMFRYLTLEVGLAVGVLLIVAEPPPGCWAWRTGEATASVRSTRRKPAYRDSRRRVFYAGIPDRPLQFFSQRSGDVAAMKDAGDLFDQYAAAYEQALSNAIAPSGRKPRIFCRGPSGLAQALPGQIGQTPAALLDFGCGDGATTPLLLRELNAEPPWEWMSPLSPSNRAQTPRQRASSLRIHRRIPRSGRNGPGLLQRRVPPHLPAQRAAAWRWFIERCARGDFFRSGRIIRGAWRRAMSCRAARSIATPSLLSPPEASRLLRDVRF